MALTPDQNDLVLALAPGGLAGDPRPMPQPEFLDRWGATDGVALGLAILEDASSERSSDDVESALVVLAVFGTPRRAVPALADLLYADWHVSHNNIAILLQRLGDERGLAGLLHVSHWIPPDLEWDENRALARAALFAIAAIPGPQAAVALHASPGRSSPGARRAGRGDVGEGGRPDRSDGLVLPARRLEQGAERSARPGEPLP